LAGFGPTEELWRRAIDLNLRFYGALGRLTIDYLRDLVTVLGDLRSSPPGRPSAAREEPSTAPPQRGNAVMVLEEGAGSAGLGVFLVENHLDHEVSARPVASVFVDPAGHEIRPTVRFDPEVVTLRAGEQLLVRVTATIDETLEPDVRYQGEVTIPELSGTCIPIVLRRRAVPDKAPGPTPSSASASSPPKKRVKPSRPVKHR